MANATKALRKLGVVEAVLAGTPATGSEIRSWRGEVLYEVPDGALEERYSVSAGLYWVDLQTTLLSALPDDAARLGAECVSFEQDGAGVTVRFADRREERGKLLIGADGLNLTIRAQLFDAEKTTLRRLHSLAWGWLRPARNSCATGWGSSREERERGSGY